MFFSTNEWKKGGEKGVKVRSDRNETEKKGRNSKEDLEFKIYATYKAILIMKRVQFM